MSDQPIKILTVTSIYPTEEDPGLGAFVASQVRSLQKLDHQVDVLFLDVRRSKWELLKGIGRVRDCVATNAYDLIHVHFGYNGVSACLQSRIPVVISFCGTDINHPKLLPISRWAARRADACIVKTEALLQRLKHPAEIIPNGVDMDLFQPISKDDARHQLGLSTDRKYALFISNPDRPEKRFGLAQQAVKTVRGKGCPTELIALHNRPQQELPLYFNAADCLILSSSREGSPNTVKEAMACNLPIVSTDVGDVRNIIEGTRHCAVCQADPNALSTGLLNALQAQTPSDGRSRIAHLSAESVAARVVKVYHRVLEGRQS